MRLILNNFFLSSGKAWQGAAYLFNFAGHLVHKFVASDGGVWDCFGAAVASYGTMLVVGAHSAYKDSDKTGAAYVYNLDNKTELHKLTPTDGAHGDRFGTGVAIYGDTIMVTAYYHGFCGAVYTFDALSGDQRQKFTNTDTPKSWYFGRSDKLAIYAGKNVGIVGHAQENRGGNLSNAGAVYIFDLGTGAQVRKIPPLFPTAGMLFGSSVVVSGDFLMVGAPRHCSGKGGVYVFDILADWEETAFFGLSDGQIGGEFGDYMSSSGPDFIVSAWAHAAEPGHDVNNGAVYVGKTIAGAKYVQ